MEMFGPKIFKDRVIELNASDERGINVVRNRIVTFAKSAIGGSDPNYICPPYKIIILDEADAMTTEAQAALRKTMEDTSEITRFCFICNYINQIIEPITSRCAKFRFKSLNKKSMMEKLSYIAKKENLNLKADTIKVITSISGGDLRKAITLLQNLQYVILDEGEITIDHVYEIASCISIKKLNKIEKICFKNKKKDISQIVNLTHEIRLLGYPIFNTLNQIHNLVINSDILTDRMKSLITLHFAKTEKRLNDGADEFLQLLSVLVCIKSVSLGLETIYNRI